MNLCYEGHELREKWFYPTAGVAELIGYVCDTCPREPIAGWELLAWCHAWIQQRRPSYDVWLQGHVAAVSSRNDLNPATAAGMPYVNRRIALQEATR